MRLKYTNNGYHCADCGARVYWRRNDNGWFWTGNHADIRGPWADGEWVDRLDNSAPRHECLGRLVFEATARSIPVK